MTAAPAPARRGHAPGWTWRRDHAGAVARPWPADLPAHVGGLCQAGWHGDCPQAPILTVGPGTCSCSCHKGTALPETTQPSLTPGSRST